MRTILLAFAVLLSLRSAAQDLRAWARTRYPESKSVEIYRSPYDPSLRALIVVQEKDWWEQLMLVRVAAGKVAWEARIDSAPHEQSIRSVRAVALPGIHGSFFEVFGQTHMGNGYYYLYELRGRRLLRACTKAVDRNEDGGSTLPGDGKLYSTVFRNEQLTPNYRDVNGDGRADIVLRGTILITDDYGTVVQSRPARKVLLYRHRSKAFVEDRKRRLGFAPDDF